MNQIPEWANWMAKFRSGSIFVFEEKPNKSENPGIWITKTGKFTDVKKSLVPYPISWEDKYPISIQRTKIKNDPVNRPNHYIGVEGMEVREVQENFVPKYEKYGAMVMCDIKDAIKYITRAPDKNEVQDIDKAIRMLQYAKAKMTENIDSDISTFYGGTNPND